MKIIVFKSKEPPIGMTEGAVVNEEWYPQNLYRT